MKKKSSKADKSKSSVKLWLWSICAILLGVLIGIAILLWCKPRAYQPTHPDNPEQVSLYLTHQLGPDFFNQVQLEEPFELIIAQDGVNDIISRIPWPQQFGQISFSDPVINFLDQSIVLMGNLEFGNVRSILTIVCSPEMASAGTINLNIQSIQMGMVPVKALAAKLAQSIFNQNIDSFSEDPDAAAIVQSIIQNKNFDPVIWISDYKVRITNFTLDPGILKLSLQPLNH